MSELRNDLCKQIDRKLRLWARDTVELYEIADLTPHDLVEDMTTTLMHAVILCLASSPMRAEDIADTIAGAVEGGVKLVRLEKEKRDGHERREATGEAAKK